MALQVLFGRHRELLQILDAAYRRGLRARPAEKLAVKRRVFLQINDLFAQAFFLPGFDFVRRGELDCRIPLYHLSLV